MKRWMTMGMFAVGLSVWASGHAAARGTAAPTNGAERTVPLSGDLSAHDPSLIIDASGRWLLFSTGAPEVAGGTIQMRRSDDGRAWAYAGNVLESIPDWVKAAVPGVQNLWAPHIHHHGGTYYLFYSASTFGSNRSVIGLATNTTLDPSAAAYHWSDRGPVMASAPEDDFNAIDPVVAEDEQGVPWLAFGSFWSGIRAVPFDWSTGAAVSGVVPLRLADRFVPPNAIEAPAILRHRGYYYLFVSLDFCCRGVDSTYKIAVGRSRSLTGPYLDRLGTPLAHGGGTVILSERGTLFGPGGQSVSSHRGNDYLVYHHYDGALNGAHQLGIRRIRWRAGWPEVADVDRRDSDGSE
jgi:arabinan endo-1,5-alpha-L-arabinosidase